MAGHAVRRSGDPPPTCPCLSGESDPLVVGTPLPACQTSCFVLAGTSGILSYVVPTWTLLAALAAGLILGALGSRLFFRPPALQAPAEDVAPVAVAQEAEPAPPPAAPLPPPPPPPEPEPEPEAARVSMEDVVSELERRYEGRQADATGEKRAGGRRRRPGR
jgi:hypothetical protein